MLYAGWKNAGSGENIARKKSEAEMNKKRK
jgi:hypothetical protein